MQREGGVGLTPCQPPQALMQSTVLRLTYNKHSNKQQDQLGLLPMGHPLETNHTADQGAQTATRRAVIPPIPPHSTQA